MGDGIAGIGLALCRLEIGAGGQHGARLGAALGVKRLVRLRRCVAAVADIAALGLLHRVLRIAGAVVGVAKAVEIAAALDLRQRVGQGLAVARLRERVVGVEHKHRHRRDEQDETQDQFRGDGHGFQMTSLPNACTYSSN